jgi:hypothetical protein
VGRLLERSTSNAIPEAETPLEEDLFDVLTILFVAPLAALRARDAIRAALGDTNCEYIIAFLAFVRTAHYWTETHPEIEIEEDMRAVMASNEELMRLLLRVPSSLTS